ncbi:Tripeptidyl-peptidase 1 [Symbiodinium microadriaticum]|uniref:subtilisin n=1 Tax=Symbiodinium microadriaticum TaxID=2951 RepID=A0A1Q9BTM8_SYMMI|nr:Tripeptidyl-peptidase 1 [Symbiodinium microadriaticum]
MVTALQSLHLSARDVALPGQSYPVSRLNEAQRRAGRPSLGLLNPWLYQDHLCKLGFRAGPGWDPATGLGVPRFSRLLALLPRPGEHWGWNAWDV